MKALKFRGARERPAKSPDFIRNDDEPYVYLNVILGNADLTNEDKGR
jgi:hypothetical protein